MSHSLLHQVLVSGLVVPVGLAETAEQWSATSTGVRLGDDTWLRCDLVVCHRDTRRHPGRPGDPRASVDGPPLLVVEVTSAVSRAADLGAKKALYERYGVPAYWVVDSRGDLSEIRVYELGDAGRYTERARLPRGRTATLARPFPIELEADQVFARLPRRPLPAPRRTISVPDHASDPSRVQELGPDLPHSEEPILIDAFGRRWPTGAEKVELWDGCPVFYGAWDERDIEIASRAYPGRVVRLDQEPGEPGTMTVLPGPDPARRALRATRPADTAERAERDAGQDAEAATGHDARASKSHVKVS
ncbi:hypothetical protein Acsp03_17670 [Actinomadura sp. NBRC 104412]|uniref:Uma2 family endonuclease n=1 Tax=Actinomadura sp. NBRC 104412 TaxID=3032203 RepID=UPI0024A603D7|nr:Uma2 family endonuclease [Actinomadura sp. NBRC 104412]GLZ04301.1 hypothetical protein Acsp03_17670 [Actinomadura sp. NBRC 104412]